MLVSKFTWHIPLILRFVQLQHSELCSINILLPRTPLCLPDPLVNHSVNLSSFSRCVICFSMLVSQLLVIQVTPYVKALLSLQTAMASPNTTSSSSDVGKATQSMSILTNVKNLIIFKNSSTSTHNSFPLALTKLSGFNDRALYSSYLRFTLRNCRLACRDLQRDIAHSTCCDFTRNGLLHKSTCPVSC